MRILDMEKVSKLPTANDLLDEKYGKEGTASRAEFDAKALAWYYVEKTEQTGTVERRSLVHFRGCKCYR